MLKSSPAPEKSFFRRVMRPKDWIMLAVLIIISAVCWIWVYQAYSQPSGYRQILGESLANTEI